MNKAFVVLGCLTGAFLTATLNASAPEGAKQASPAATAATGCLVAVTTGGAVELRNDCQVWIKADIQSDVDAEKRTYTFQSNSYRTGSLFSNQPYHISLEKNYVEPIVPGNRNDVLVTYRRVNGEILWEAENKTSYYVDLRVDLPDCRILGRRGASSHALLRPLKVERIAICDSGSKFTVKFAVRDPL